MFRGNFLSTALKSEHFVNLFFILSDMSVTIMQRIFWNREMFGIIHRVGKNIFRIITTQRDALEADFSFNERKTIFFEWKLSSRVKNFVLGTFSRAMTWLTSMLIRRWLPFTLPRNTRIGIKMVNCLRFVTTRRWPPDLHACSRTRFPSCSPLHSLMRKL